MKKLFSLIISIIITFPTIPSVTAYECNDTYATDTDSIYIVNDSIRTEIKYIKEQHKKDSVSIMSANDSVLLDIFTRYIEDYNNK